MFCLQFVAQSSSVCLSVCLSCLSAWVDYLTECLCVHPSLHCGVMTAGCGTGLTGQTRLWLYGAPPCWNCWGVADHDGAQSRSKKGPDSTSHARTPRCSCGLTATATMILPGYLDILGR